MNKFELEEFFVGFYFALEERPLPRRLNNFENRHRKTVEKTLKVLSSKHKRGLFIRDIATYGDNKILNGHFSLMTSIHVNRSVFWEAYNFQKIKQLKRGRRLRK